MALGEMLLGGLQKAWEAVANAVNVIVEWVKEKVKEILESVLEKIKGMLSGYLTSLGKNVMFSQTERMEEFIQSFNLLMLAGTAIALSILIIGAIISPFTVGIGNILALIIMMIIQMIISEVDRYIKIDISPTMGVNDIIELIIELFRGTSKDFVFQSHKVNWSDLTLPQPQLNTTIWDWCLYFLSWFVTTSAMVSAVYYHEPLTSAIVGFCVAAIAGLGAFFLQDYYQYTQDIEGVKRMILFQAFLSAVAIWLSSIELLVYPLFFEVNLGAKILSVITLVIGIVSLGYYFYSYKEITKKNPIATMT
jgi:uncharacterized membrane-anchored protein